MRKLIQLSTVILSMLFTVDVKASVIYSYIGNNYDYTEAHIQSTGEVIESIYDYSMQISGILEFDSFLLPNLDNTSVNPINAVFTDGVNTAELSSSPINIFNVSTDEMGNIIAWSIDMITPPPPTFGVDFLHIETRSDDVDAVLYSRCIDIECSVEEVYFASVTNNSGTWSVVPIPAAIWIFGSGLIGLIGVARGNKS